MRPYGLLKDFDCTSSLLVRGLVKRRSAKMNRFRSPLYWGCYDISVEPIKGRSRLHAKNQILKELIECSY